MTAAVRGSWAQGMRKSESRASHEPTKLQRARTMLLPLPGGEGGERAGVRAGVPPTFLPPNVASATGKVLKLLRRRFGKNDDRNFGRNISSVEC